MMTPQLFINYKMKSVAHLPWRMLTYKALNTFIDDLFAFVIKMPTLYRLGCFRDGTYFCGTIFSILISTKIKTIISVISINLKMVIFLHLAHVKCNIFTYGAIYSSISFPRYNIFHLPLSTLGVP